MKEQKALSCEERNKTSSLTSISPLVYPVDKGTDSGEHGKVVGPTVFVPPTHSATKNPSSTLVAYERPATVSLRSKRNLIDNRQSSVYQYSNMVPKLLGETSKFDGVFFASKRFWEIERQRKL